MVLCDQCRVIMGQTSYMQLPGKDLQQLLEKYQQGSASPEERRLLEQWYEQLDITAGQQWSTEAEEAAIRKEIYTGVAAKMTRKESPAKQAPVITSPVYRIGWRKIGSVAAVLLVIAGMAWLGSALWQQQPVAGQLKRAEQKEQIPIPSTVIPAQELTIRNGQAGPKKIVLPDGSTAWLNTRSVLKYPGHFTSNNRMVRVEQGEVFFNVIRDTAHPFIVYTGSTATTVLGTSFLVKQSFEKNTLEVMVKTGKVKVEKFNSRGAYTQVGNSLLPGDRLSFDTTTNTYSLKRVSLKGIAAFMEGKLVYDDATLEEIVYDISRKYNIAIRFENDRLKQCHYRISFDDIPLNDCLQVLSLLTNTHIEKGENRRYTIKGESCN